MNRKAIFFLVLLLGSMLMVPLRAEEPTLDELLWNGLPYTELSDMNEGWTPTIGEVSYSNGHMTLSNPVWDGRYYYQMGANYVFNTPFDLTRCNPAFRMATMGEIPNTVYFYLIYKDVNGVSRQYTFGNRARSLIGSNTWGTHFISWSHKIYDWHAPSSFDYSRVKQIEIKFYLSDDQFSASFDDLRAYPEVNPYDRGYVIITSDGTRTGINDTLIPKLKEYDYGYSPAVAPYEDYEDLELITYMYDQGYDIQLYARVFDSDYPTEFLPYDELYRNTVTATQMIEELCPGHKVIDWNMNRHLSDERNIPNAPLIQKGSDFTSSASLTGAMSDFYGSTRRTVDDIKAITWAATTKTGYIWFDHHYEQTHYAAKPPEEIEAVVDHIHATGCKVVTYTQYLHDVLAYVNQNPNNPQPEYSIHLICNSTGYYVWINNVDETVRHFTTRTDAENYLSETMTAWEGN